MDGCEVKALESIFVSGVWLTYKKYLPFHLIR